MGTKVIVAGPVVQVGRAISEAKAVGEAGAEPGVWVIKSVAVGVAAAGVPANTPGSGASE